MSVPSIQNKLEVTSRVPRFRITMRRSNHSANGSTIKVGRKCVQVGSKEQGEGTLTREVKGTNPQTKANEPRIRARKKRELSEVRFTAKIDTLSSSELSCCQEGH